MSLDYFVSPRIMGRQLRIHPLAAIFAVLAGAEIGGIVGVYLAVPVMPSMRLILDAGGEERAERRHHRHSESSAEAPSRLEESAAG